MDASSVSSFYEPPVEYDEGKTVELYEKLKTNFQELEGLLGGIKKNLGRVQRESALMVKLVEKLNSAETTGDQNDNQNANDINQRSRNKTPKSK